MSAARALVLASLVAAAAAAAVRPAPAANASQPLMPGRTQKGGHRHHHHHHHHEIPREWFSHIIGGSEVTPPHKYQMLSQVCEAGDEYECVGKGGGA